MEKKRRALFACFQGLLIILMTVLVFCMVAQIDNLQGTARVLNYAGLVRGATQREIKLEIVGQDDDDLIAYLDEITYGLRNGSRKYGLVQLPDEKYLTDLDKQIAVWQQLKEEIYRVRQEGYAATEYCGCERKIFPYGGSDGFCCGGIFPVHCRYHSFFGVCNGGGCDAADCHYDYPNGRGCYNAAEKPPIGAKGIYR